MRVVSGRLRGRTFKAVPSDCTRPVLDRVKTALFDILRPNLENIEVLDLFGGSGSIGIEALSQGASWCTFVDLGDAAVKTIKENVRSLDIETFCEVRKMDAYAYLKNTSRSFDLIYVAPPQYKGIWSEIMYSIAERPGVLKKNGRVLVQIDPKENENLCLERIKLDQERRYGNTLLLFYSLTDV
jgi:16S rRNA (guanine966-N2)-methyltransferase